MPPKEITILKPLKDLKLREDLEEVYVYMDFNKRTIEPYYNDEVKLPLNIGKIMQKAYPQIIIKPKKLFSYLNDIKIQYDKEKQPDNLVITFYPSF
jgi:hypothetical protein